MRDVTEYRIQNTEYRIQNAVLYSVFCFTIWIDLRGVDLSRVYYKDMFRLMMRRCVYTWANWRYRRSYQTNGIDQGILLIQRVEVDFGFINEK